MQGLKVCEINHKNLELTTVICIKVIKTEISRYLYGQFTNRVSLKLYYLLGFIEERCRNFRIHFQKGT